MLATLLLSQGTPMLLAGDEFGRTQHGNNNPYNQDNATSWLDWNIGERGETADPFRAGTDRAAPPLPRAAPRPLPDGRPGRRAPACRDVTWLNALGREMTGADWDDGNLRCFGMLLDGRARATGVRRVSSDSSMLIVLNAHHEGVGFTLPAITGGTIWRLVFDTNAPNHEEDVAVGETYTVTGRSVLLFERLSGRSPDRRRRPRRRLAESPAD